MAGVLRIRNQQTYRQPKATNINYLRFARSMKGDVPKNKVR
jgi:hypothetical protein